MATAATRLQAREEIKSEAYMASDEKLNELYSDAETLERLFANEHTGEMFRDMWADIQANKPDQERPFLLAMKKGFYRKTDEYTNAACNASIRAKDAPKTRSMAGFGSNAYRTWSR